MRVHRFVGGAAIVCTVAAVVGSCESSGPNESVYTGRRDASQLPGIGDGGTVLDAEDSDGQILPSQPFTKSALIQDVADCALSGYKRFEVAMVALQAKTSSYAAAPTGLSLAEAQTAWRVAMGLWQQAELYGFGPAARAPAPGALGLRDQIYSFPPAARCQVDVQLVNQAYKRNDFANTFVSGRGLGGLEYLLFNTANINACLPSSDINSKGTWAILSVEELQRRRADYAVVVATDVLTRARTLVGAWESGGFKQQLILAGGGSNVFDSAQSALNAISDAVFYLDQELKDEKLGVPSGRHQDCFPNMTCPEALESAYARESTSNIVNNLLGARNVLLGCGAGGSGLGFDDWLRGIGRDDLAVDLGVRLNAALTLAQDPQLILEDALATMLGKVLSLHAAIQQLTTLLKADIATSLNLGLPMKVADDTDS